MTAMVKHFVVLLSLGVVLVPAVGPAWAVPIEVTTSPAGATVYVDGAYAGVTPLEGYELDAGTYLLRLVRHGYQTLHETIEVTQDQRVFAFQLDVVPVASLTITSEPDDAEVYLNGESVGRTPLTLSDLDPGEYDVRIQKPNFIAAVHTVQLDAAANEVHFELTERTVQYYLHEIEAQPETLSNYTELAHLYLVDGDIPQAMDIFRKGIELSATGTPHNDDVTRLYQELEHAYRGQFKIGTGDDDAYVREQLEQIIEEVMEKDPEHAAQRRSLASVYTRFISHLKIIELCQRIVKDNPDSPVFRQMGGIYLQRGQMEEAIDLLERAVQQLPEDFESASMLAMAYHRSNRLDDAEKLYDIALKLDAKDSSKGEVFFMRSRLYRKKGQFAEAEKVLRSAVELAPDLRRKLTWKMQLVDVLIQLKKFDEAEDICNEVIEADDGGIIDRRARQRLRSIAIRRGNAADQKTPAPPTAEDPAP